MRTSTIIGSAVTLLAATTQARITGFYAPKTVAVDSDVKLLIRGEDYIQSIQDVAIAFGSQHGTNPTPDSLGTLLGSKYLGPDNSNVEANITAIVHIPSGTQKGKTVLTASLFSLIGALYSPDTEDFQVTVKVGEFTSSEYVFSHSVSS
jgi:hypothetical protein